MVIFKRDSVASGTLSGNAMTFSFSTLAVALRALVLLIAAFVSSHEVCAEDVAKFDFSSGSAPIAEGYTRVDTRTVKTSGKKLGWVSPTLVKVGKNALESDPIYDDFHLLQGGRGKLLIPRSILKGNSTYSLVVRYEYLRAQSKSRNHQLKIALNSKSLKALPTKTLHVSEIRRKETTFLLSTKGKNVGLPITLDLTSNGRQFKLYSLSLTTRDSKSPAPTASPTPNSNSPGLPTLPEISINAPNEIMEGSSVSLAALSNSAETSGRFSWSFSDGTSGTGARIEKVFTNDGATTVSLTYSESTSRTVTKTKVLTILNAAPTVSMEPISGGFTGIPMFFKATGVDPGSADNLTYRWNFGDGSTGEGATASHSYSNQGAYNVTVRVTDDSGATSSTANIVTVTTRDISSPLSVTPDFIIGSHGVIPNFGGRPNVQAVTSGLWSSQSTWTRPLQANDIVSIPSGVVVTFDQVNETLFKTVIIQPGGRLEFKTDVNTKLRVENLMVMEGGDLVVGSENNPISSNVRAQIMFPDTPLDLVSDPFQFGHGLLGFGKITMAGAVKSPTFVRLAAEPLQGQTLLSLSVPATGWKVGDTIILPGTRGVYDAEGYTNSTLFSPQWEILTITAISTDGKRITISSPLRFDHKGGYTPDWRLDFLPHVANITRNIQIRSENSLGTRGHTFFTARADVNIRYVQFAGLGRTTNDPDDDTIVNSSGAVTHVGTNQKGRYPVHFHHLLGPLQPPANGYQFTMVGNSVVCLMNDFRFRWGVTVRASHHGLVKDNVVYNWAGAGIVAEDGTESFNVFENNFVSRVFGTGSRDNDGRDGSGMWLHGPNNYVRGNIATNIRGYGPYAYGFNITPIYLGRQRIPAFPGANLKLASETVEVDMNAIPIREFKNNEVYGETWNGIATYWINTFGGDDIRGPSGGVLENFTTWNLSGWSFFGYDESNLTLDGWVVRADPRVDAQHRPNTAIFFSDYNQRGTVIKNFDIQGVANGILTPNNPHGRTLIKDGYIWSGSAFYIDFGWSVNGAGVVTDHETVIDNVRFDTRPFAPGATSHYISFAYNPVTAYNLIAKDDVYVKNFNGVQGDTFRVYREQQAPNFVMPQTGSNLIGQPSGRPILASPEAGLSNLQNLIKYGIALGGSIATSSQRRQYIDGFVDPTQSPSP